MRESPHPKKTQQEGKCDGFIHLFVHLYSGFYDGYMVTFVTEFVQNEDSSSYYQYADGTLALALKHWGGSTDA